MDTGSKRQLELASGTMVSSCISMSIWVSTSFFNRNNQMWRWPSRWRLLMRCWCFRDASSVVCWSELRWSNDRHREAGFAGWVGCKLGYGILGGGSDSDSRPDYLCQMTFRTWTRSHFGETFLRYFFHLPGKNWLEPLQSAHTKKPAVKQNLPLGS